MGTQLTPHDAELYQRMDEASHYLWDPIGISRTPEARDEYYGYLPKLFSLLKEDASTDDIVNYLNYVSTERMGLQENMKHTRAIATLLQNWKKRIDAKFCGDVV